MTGVLDRPADKANEENPSATAADRPIGYGRIQRKEDPRFIAARATTSTTSCCPGMLHGAILRSPVAHARIISIDVSEALAHPRVHA